MPISIPYGLICLCKVMNQTKFLMARDIKKNVNLLFFFSFFSYGYGLPIHMGYSWIENFICFFNMIRLILTQNDIY